MSMHKKPLTDLERAGLEAHGLHIGKPSQLSDCFRSGIAWAQQRIAELEEQDAALARELGQERYHRRAVEESEQALAAHVELITMTARFLIKGLVDDDQWKPNSSTGQIFSALIHDLDKKPTTALVERDLLQQSEGAHKVAHAVLHSNLLRDQSLSKQEYAAGVATLIGNQLYQQANAGEAQ